MSVIPEDGITKCPEKRTRMTQVINILRILNKVTAPPIWAPPQHQNSW